MSALEVLLMAVFHLLVYVLPTTLIRYQILPRTKIWGSIRSWRWQKFYHLTLIAACLQSVPMIWQFVVVPFIDHGNPQTSLRTFSIMLSTRVIVLLGAYIWAVMGPYNWPTFRLHIFMLAPIYLVVQTAFEIFILLYTSLYPEIPF